MSILQENDIDEDAAREFLYDYYTNFDFLPGVPDNLDRQTAAMILDVSMPTIDRMLSDKQIQLTRQSLLDYIMSRMLCYKPVLDITPVDTPAPIDKPQKANKTLILLNTQPSLFSDEDLCASGNGN